MITVKHTSIEISNYNMGDCPTLEKCLGVWDSAIFTVTWSAFIYDEETETLTIPGGFNVAYLKHLLPTKTVKYESKPSPSTPAIFKMNVQPKDEKQEIAIDFLTSKNEFENLKTETQRMLCLKTGGGKTYCTINALSKKRLRSIILVDQDKIMKQWASEITKFTSLHDNDIYMIAGSSTIDKILNSSTDLNYKVFIASHKTIGSYASKHGWEKITELFDKLKVGVKVYDEAHVEYKNIFLIDAHTNVKDTIYLTATPGRSDRAEDKVYQNMFKKVPTYGLEEKFEDNYHNIYYVSYNSKPTLQEQGKCSTRYGFNANAFSDYTFDVEDNYDKFIEVINRLLKITMKSKNKTAIIVHKNEHLLKLKETLSEMYPDVEIGTFSTVIKSTTERQKELDKQLIISTDKSLGKAVDIPNLQYLLMTVPTSSKIVTEQILGRLRRLEGKKVFYFDITDVGFESCKSQRYNRRKVLDLKAISISNLDLK